MNRAVRRGIRTLLQLVAGGGLTALVALIAEDLEPNTKAIVLAAFTLAVTFVQNLLEGTGTVPVLLPAPAPALEVPTWVERRLATDERIAE